MFNKTILAFVDFFSHFMAIGLLSNPQKGGISVSIWNTNGMRLEKCVEVCLKYEVWGDFLGDRFSHLVLLEKIRNYEIASLFIKTQWMIDQSGCMFVCAWFLSHMIRDLSRSSSTNMDKVFIHDWFTMHCCLWGMNDNLWLRKNSNKLNSILLDKPLWFLNFT